MASIEERNLEFQEKLLEYKKELLKEKQKEKSAPPPPPASGGKSINPVIATIAVAIIGFIASTIGTMINNSNTYKLEQRKFESELIKKSMDQPTPQDIIKSLKLLTTLNLVHDDEVRNALDSFLRDTGAAKEALPGFTVPVTAQARDNLFQLYEKEFGGVLKKDIRERLSQLFDFIAKDTAIKDVRYVAYILATLRHETANTFLPLEEMNHGRGLPYGQKLRRDKTPYTTPDKLYYGRGYLQLTWIDNYEMMNTALKLEGTENDIVQNPDKLLDPVIAYKVYSYGLIHGTFTGKKLGDYINGNQTDYVNARKLINGFDHAEMIAEYATKFEKILRQSLGQK